MGIVHKFKYNNINMLIDTNSGAFHIVDDIVYDIVDSYKEYSNEDLMDKFMGKHSRAEIEDALNEIKALEKEGLLYTEDPYEKMVLSHNEESYIKAMCLNIAHDCNLKCKYCFASQGDYNGSRALMNIEVGRAAIDFILKRSGTRKNIEIDLFGGEPLMNFEMIKSLVAYARKKEKEFGKNIRFTMTTNATLLNDEIMDFIDKNMGNIVLSIDGRKEINDSVRTRWDGSGTYNDILPKIKKMVEKRDKNKQYYVRGTFTSKNLDFYNDVVELADQGFKEISIEPVVLDPSDELSLNEEHLSTIFNQYGLLAEEIIRRERNEEGFKFYHFAIDVDGGPCVYKRVSGCGAGFEYIAVTPEGDIYPCHQFVGNESYKMGTVFNDTIDNNISVEFKNGHIYNKPQCLNCWAKFYCSGGCQANNFNFNGSILEPYKLGCEMQKKRIECSLYIKAAQYLDTVEG